MYTLSQTDAGRSGAYSITEAGVAVTLRQETGSSLGGTYTATASGSDSYALSEAGFDGNANPVSSSLSGADNSTLSERGNALTGDLSRTQSGQGNVNRVGVSVSYTAQESGNALAGGFSLSESGTDRYALLPQFNNPASSGTGTAPGTEVFSGEGPAYGLGPVAGVSGAGVTHMGGMSAEGSDSSRSTGYDDGSGRLARARAAATAIQSATEPDAGAQQQQRSAELGAEVFKKYCFAAETPIETGTGSQPISSIKAGDSVWSAPDDDPRAPAQLKVVEEVFSDFAPVIRIHVGGQIIRTTAEHHFFTARAGWVPAGALERGDLFRGRDGRWVEVGSVEDRVEETEVYNLRVADFHTYFVGSLEWAFSVWSHNIYTEAVKTSFSKLLSMVLGQDFQQAVKNRIYEIGRVAPTETQGEAWANHWTKAELAGLPNKAEKALAKVDAQAKAMGLPLPEELVAQQRAAREAASQVLNFAGDHVEIPGVYLGRRPVLPLYIEDGPTSGVVVPIRPDGSFGTAVSLSSTQEAGYRYPYEQADGHMETNAALWMRDNNETAAIVFHNCTKGTCHNCHVYLSDFLAQGSRMYVVPPSNAVAANSSWIDYQTQYVGNSRSLESMR